MLLFKATYSAFRLYIFCHYVCSFGIEPTTFALLMQCSATEPQEHYIILFSKRWSHLWGLETCYCWPWELSLFDAQVNLKKEEELTSEPTHNCWSVNPVWTDGCEFSHIYGAFTGLKMVTSYAAFLVIFCHGSEWGTFTHSNSSQAQLQSTRSAFAWPTYRNELRS